MVPLVCSKGAWGFRMDSEFHANLAALSEAGASTGE